MWSALLVFGGGGVGALARYGVALAAQRWTQVALPLGTLAVNALGCLAAGAAIAWFDARPNAGARALLVVGVLGGFTTFSAFGVETLALVRDQRVAAALANVALNVGLSLVAVALGWSIARAALT